MKWPNFAIEHHRVKEGRLASSNLDGPNGAFHFKCNGVVLRVIVGCGMGWDHVSVSVVNKKRCPTWKEMHYIKRIFWADNEAVMQLHPPASVYVNNHPGVLHMWKPQGIDIPLPPEICVGFKQLGNLTAEQARTILDQLETT
jgi:hypothetical protein